MSSQIVTAIIIEDEIAAYNHLHQLIINSFSDKIKIVGNATSVKDGIHLINHLKPTLVFLDIQLEDGDGFEILDNVKTSEFEVIFTTGSADYREKAMDYFAFYFLNKPILETQFITVITKFLEKQTSFDLEKYLAFKNQIEHKHQNISLPIKNGFEIVALDKLIYCEAEGSYTYFYTTSNKKYMTSNNLKKIESLLQQATFFRIHRSILVNLKHIVKYENSGKVHLTNGKELVVAARNKKNFLRIIKLMSFSIS
ncbi:LytTR family DNA-binding domain-containing protein [Lutibacter sp.]|uniref:LytR/AlgR family response regulator transcription factor n=1 Tax=Lutibacter sp. TaxID=1925666 RepID=UPI0025BAAEE7|nr:LytTR family DNA-binding domain-containing protein [Lutibacter sp.]MCF6180700.1 LytTR family DNA-binding domain-containing protein [Lutibacter sp.]